MHLNSISKAYVHAWPFFAGYFRSKENLRRTVSTWAELKHYIVRQAIVNLCK